MEDDELFDPLHFDVPEETVKKFKAIPITILVSEEAGVTLLNLKNKGFPIDDRLFDNVSRLLLSYKDRVKTSA